MDADLPSDAAGTPAEQRLAELLGQIRRNPPQPPAALTSRVVNSARWEGGLRHAGSALGGFGATLLEGISILLGVRRPRS